MSRKRPFTIDDAFGFKVISDAQITSDGRHFAFVAEDGPSAGPETVKSKIFVGPCDSSTPPRPLGSSSHRELSPRWSPNSHTLSFVTQGDDGSRALFIKSWPDGPDSRLDLGSVEEESGRLTLSAGLGAGAAPSWSPRGDRLAFIARSTSPSRTNLTHDHRIVPPGGDRLWAVDIDTGEVSCLIRDFHVWEFTWGSGDEIVALISEEPTMPSWMEGRLVSARQESSVIEEIYRPEPEEFVNSRGRKFHFTPTVSRPTVSSDGRYLAFVLAATEEPGIVGGDVYVLDRSTGEVRNLTEGEPVSVSWINWGPDGHIYVAQWIKGEQALGRIALDGSRTTAWRGEAAFADRYQPRFSMSDDGTILLVREDRRQPREVFRVDGLADDNPRWTQVSHLQPDIGDLVLAEFERVTWTGRDGREIEGHLLLPPDTPIDGGLPMVVYPHGGPSFLQQHLFNGWFEGPYGTPFELFPANGFALLLPNFRGSIGWGREFADLKVGDFGGEDIHDIIRGVEALVDQGIADPSRVGIAGWSMAGYQAGWATCESQLFKAAVVGTAVADWRSLPLQSNPVPLLLPFFGVSDPYAPDDLHDERALVRRCAEADAAWLIVHTGLDPWVPPNHAYALFHALRNADKNVEFLLYEDENHAIRSRDNRADVSARVIEFFNHWLS